MSAGLPAVNVYNSGARVWCRNGRLWVLAVQKRFWWPFQRKIDSSRKRSTHEKFATDDSRTLLLRAQPEGLSGDRIEDIGDRLDLKIVIARTERPHFPALSFLGAFGDMLGPRALHLAVFLDALQVPRLSQTLLNSPTSTAQKHRVHGGRIERDRSFAADAGGPEKHLYYYFNRINGFRDEQVTTSLGAFARIWAAVKSLQCASLVEEGPLWAYHCRNIFARQQRSLRF